MHFAPVSLEFSTSDSMSSRRSRMAEAMIRERASMGASLTGCGIMNELNNTSRAPLLRASATALVKAGCW